MRWIHQKTRSFVEDASELGIKTHSWAALAEGSALLFRLACRLGEKETGKSANQIAKVFLKNADEQLAATAPRELRAMFLGPFPRLKMLRWMKRKWRSARPSSTRGIGDQCDKTTF